jgi:hypothetical protein
VWAAVLAGQVLVMSTSSPSPTVQTGHGRFDVEPRISDIIHLLKMSFQSDIINGRYSLFFIVRGEDKYDWKESSLYVITAFTPTTRLRIVNNIGSQYDTERFVPDSMFEVDEVHLL